VSKVLFRGTLSVTAKVRETKKRTYANIISPTIIQHDLGDFLLIHEEYVHPRRVLEDDKYTLMGVTENKVFFCESSSDVYDSSIIPFVFIAHYVWAQKIISMPIASFLK